jgi:hypothetical protein
MTHSRDCFKRVSGTADRIFRTATVLLLILTCAGMAHSQTASLSVSPSSITGSVSTLRMTFGWITPVRLIHFVIGTAADDQARTCRATFDVANRQFFLFADDGRSQAGPLTPGIQGTVSNSQCSVSQLNANINLFQSTVSLEMQISLSTSFAGNRGIWMGLTPWSESASPLTRTGTWNMPVSIAVAVAPATTTISAKQTKQFTASVTGSTNTGVTWSTSSGTISSSGLYTAPPAIAAQTTATVTATSIADPTRKAQAIVTLVPPVAISVMPSSGVLQPSSTLQLRASVSGSSNTGIAWTLSEPVGTLSATGDVAVYTSPALIQQQRTVEVRVQSVADRSKIVTAVLTLMPAVSISAAPAVVEVKAGATQQFTAPVTGTSNTAVEWSVSPAIGTISPAGLYTAPATVTDGQEITITASAAADRTKRAVARATLVTGRYLSYTLGSEGLESLVYRGINYNYKYGERLVSYLSFQTPQGIVRKAPSCTGSLVGNQVTRECSLDGRPVSVKATFTPCANDGICAEMQVTNKSSDVMTEAMLSTFGISTTQYNASGSGPFPVGGNEPTAMFDLVAARAGMWIDTPARNVQIATECGFSTICKNHLMLRNGIAPGETATRRYCMRFTADATLSRLQLMPEAYEAYRAAYPPVINWPDRRPIMMWWVAENGKTSATNPRGYMQDPTLQVSNTAEFRKRMTDRARFILNQMNAQPAKPQGIILWDIEGQEFIHPTTYIGDPRVFNSGYAPEMNGVADEVFGIFTSAGYRVGVTLRPQYMQWGKTLPATCKTDPYNGWKDYFIKVDAPYKQAFHGCYDHGWGLVPAGNGSQTEFKKGQEQKILDLLRSKAAYAKKRWGVTIFYVDSAVYTGGGPIDSSIFRTLQSEFPDCLFIPEQESMATMAAAIPFTDMKSPGDAKVSPLTWRWAYPNAAMAVKWNDCTGSCWDANLWQFKTSQKIGDIALMSVAPQVSETHLANVMSTILDVRKESGNVFVTDSTTGRKLSFSGRPAEILPYPVKLRVYFAASATQLPASTLQCEAGQWLGENACTLDLNGMTVSQVRYYDFAGKLVKTEPAQPLN